MNISVGKTTLRRNNWPGFGALLASLTAVGVLAGVGIWQATDSDSTTTVSSPPAARPVDLQAAITPSYFYLVDSQAEADLLYEIAFEQEMNFGGNGTFNSNFSVIDMSTPEGQETYRLLNAELTQAQLGNSYWDPALVQIIDMTAPATSGVAASAARPVDSDIDSPGVPTFFYVVESKEQADKVHEAEAMAALEAMSAGIYLEPHHTEIVDVSTLEGQQLLNTINGELFEMWADPNVDQSLVQIIDARAN
jgi:hypothetical protein